VVSGGRTLDGHGNRQRWNGGRRRGRAACHRGHPDVFQLAMVFVACGAVGLLWALWWTSTYAEASAMRRRHPQRFLQPRRTWSSLLSLRQVWGLVGAKFLTDAAWFFYIAWLPKYLYDARGFDVKQVGYYAWVPFAAAGSAASPVDGSRAG
jgi:predicted MFS family arabinose efflux permease